ncbi:MAG TPA: CopD family protein [Kofleriaceae bacterium]|nr:CopD family protein [Kofleriaceae bacterium]
MSVQTSTWLLAGHLIGLFVWLGGMFTVYWMLRLHAHAPKDAHEKLVLAERSLALMMDIGSALAIGCGLGLAFGQTPTVFTRPGAGWFHIKLTVVVLGILSVHGMLRARIKKFSQGKISEVPSWQWSVLLGSIAVIILLVFKGPLWFAKSPDKPAPPSPAGAMQPMPTEQRPG